MLGADFTTNEVLLDDLLKAVNEGALQLPDFQRPWRWDDERIRSLIASISVSFPINAIMTLENGGNVSFKPRLIEGASLDRPPIPDILLLDGQQRLTSLYQALFTEAPVRTRDLRGKVLHRHYYINMELALSDAGERDEWIFGVPEDRQVRRLREIELDLSSPELEYKQKMFPLDQIFDAASWRRGFNRYHGQDDDKADLFDRFEEEVIERFKKYQVPVIQLAKNTSKEAVCLVFEKVNTGGVTLTVFELVTASFAAENFQLREDWEQRRDRMRERFEILSSVQGDQFLQAVTLMATLERRRLAMSTNPSADRQPAVGCRRREILQLSLAEYERWAEAVERGFVEAARFLRRQHVFKAQDIPYQTQLVPLAAIFSDLGQHATADSVQQNIARWYWCGVLGEMYAGAVETIFARDLLEVVNWIKAQGGEPSTIRDAGFQANRLLTLRTRNSAAYKGIHALLMREGSLDFRTAEPLVFQVFDEESVDIHHIFPQKWCNENNPPIPPTRFNSIVNKTAISAHTNRMIGGRAPSDYLERLEAEIDSARLSEVLRSHLIPERALRNDDFWGFFETRAGSLLQLIEGAMHKPVTRDPEAFRPDTEIEEYEDETEQ